MAALAIPDTGERRVLALSGPPRCVDDPRRLARRAPRARGIRPAGAWWSMPPSVDYCDGAGIALLIDLMRQSARAATSRSRT